MGQPISIEEVLYHKTIASLKSERVADGLNEWCQQQQQQASDTVATWKVEVEMLMDS